LNFFHSCLSYVDLGVHCSLYPNTYVTHVSVTSFFVGFELVTELRMMSTTICWDIAPCSPLKVNRRFGGTYRLHF
jgi:hypothetical protein